MIGVRMRLALKWCQRCFRTFLFRTIRHLISLLAVHKCLFVFVVNRDDSRMHSTLGLFFASFTQTTQCNTIDGAVQ